MGQRLQVGRKQFIKDLSREIEFKGGDGRELGKPYEHLKRLRMPMTDETRIQPNTKYLEAVSYHLGLTGAVTTDAWCVVMTHRPTMDATPLLTATDLRLYRSFVGAFMYHMLNRTDAQLEGSSLGSYLRDPTNGAMEALRRALIQSRWNWWATRTATGLVTPHHGNRRVDGDVEVDGCPLTSCSRRRSCVATSSGMAEHCAMCSTAEELLHLRWILEHLGFSVNTTDFCGSVVARGSEQRAGLGKVRALAVETLWLQEVAS